MSYGLLDLGQVEASLVDDSRRVGDDLAHRKKAVSNEPPNEIHARPQGQGGHGFHSDVPL